LFLTVQPIVLFYDNQITNQAFTLNDVRRFSKASARIRCIESRKSGYATYDGIYVPSFTLGPDLAYEIYR